MSRQYHLKVCPQAEALPTIALSFGSPITSPEFLRLWRRSADRKIYQLLIDPLLNRLPSQIIEHNTVHENSDCKDTCILTFTFRMFCTWFLNQRFATCWFMLQVPIHCMCLLWKGCISWAISIALLRRWYSWACRRIYSQRDMWVIAQCETHPTGEKFGQRRTSQCTHVSKNHYFSRDV